MNLGRTVFGRMEWTKKGTTVPFHLRRGRAGSGSGLPCLLALILFSGKLDSIARGHDPASSSLTIEPAAVSLSGAEARQQVAVTVRREDGSLRDVTRECRLIVEPAGIADGQSRRGRQADRRWGWDTPGDRRGSIRRGRNPR